MLKGDIRCLARIDAAVTESPVWDAGLRLLFFVDIYGCRILWLDWDSGSLSSVATPEPVGCIAVHDDRRLVAGLKSGIALIDRHTGDTRYIARLEEDLPHNRLNDGRCDRSGRFFWVGTMIESLDRHTGSLYRLESDGSCRQSASGFICSNGLAWSPDGRTMYHADSRQRTVWAYDYDPECGAVSGRRVFIETKDGEGRPDGAAVDAEGCYWIARYDGWRIVRHAPDGRDLFTLPTPVQNPTMCAFAGDDLSTLVFTSAAASLSPEQRLAQPLAGSVFAVDLSATGLPEPRYRGSLD